MAQLPALEARNLTASVQDYAKAIYTLESRDGAASTTELAALLDVRQQHFAGLKASLADDLFRCHRQHAGL